MPEGTAAEKKKTCFVVMGFGKKTDFETGRTLDLDKTYKNIIKPAVETAGLKCVRADEIVHSGLIDVPMYEQLLNADVVVADLSTSNKNAFYELGVRHALRPYTTIVIAEDGIKMPLPFDVNHVTIRMYHHLGEDIGFDEVMRFRGVLTSAINTILNSDPPNYDSPVYTFIKGLRRPTPEGEPDGQDSFIKLGQPRTLKRSPHEDDARGPADDDDGPGAAVAEALGGADARDGDANSGESHSALMQQVEEAQKGDDFATAKVLLSIVRKMMKEADPNRPDDSYIIQKLALVTYKAAEKEADLLKGGGAQPANEDAVNTVLRRGYEEARELLKPLDPQTTNDTETLGLWGALHKRLWELTGDHASLDESVRAYERGFYLRNDYYNGINLAFLLNVRAADSCLLSESAASAGEATSARAEAVSCFVQAEHVRREVISICEAELNAGRMTDKKRYWVLATLAEARLGVGDEAGAAQKLEEALAVPHATWMEQATQGQMDKLRQFRADSPLKYIRADV